MFSVVDDVGRAVSLPRAAQRIVSLVPSLTETVFALGRGAAVVGITRYCVEPVGAVERIERVGGTKNPDLERIRALHPDLVIVNAEENRQADFTALEGAGLTMFVSFPRRARDTIALVQRLGELIGAPARAAAVARELAETLVGMERAGGERSVRVFCPIWKNPWMSFNRATYSDDMLALVGGHNVCAERAERYCTVTLEEIAATAPEVILLPDEPYVFQSKDLPSLDPLRGTPAWRAQRVHFIDGKALSWYGPRAAAGLRYLRTVIAPEGVANRMR